MTITADFSGQMQAFAEKTNRSLAETHRLVAIKLFNAIIMQTPIDTGEAAGGWMASMGDIKNIKPGTLGPEASMARVMAEVRALPSQIAYLSNSVGHIYGLEYGTHSYGFSPKAPEGMVRMNVARFQQLLHEAVMEMKEGK